MLILLVDDLRTFRDRRPHLRARTSSEALTLLKQTRAQPGGQLWLDHDLGDATGAVDSTLVVLDALAEAAFNENPYPFSDIVVHTANPVGAQTLMLVLHRWGYPARRVPAGEELIEESLIP